MGLGGAAAVCPANLQKGSAFDWLQMLRIQQEKIEVLGSKLSEETEWRKQLARDLEMTQRASNNEKKV